MTALAAARRTGLALAVVLWLAVGRLVLAFLRSELHWAYVAGHSRADAPWYYRAAGLWGGSEGSLLLFAAVLAAFAVAAARRAEHAGTVWFGTLSSAAVALVGLVAASPFGRLDAPAVRGFGLTPILEHPAMAVHPPLLYAGLGCSLAAAMAAVDGRAATPWLRATLGLTTLAMALGAVWSYVEQGWGGYWAWDPVENTSLLVWLAALVALHAPGVRALAVVPWLLTLGGAALVRSGATPSVHGFASDAMVGWFLLALTLLSAAALWTRVRRPRPSPTAEVPRQGVTWTAPAVAAVAAAAVGAIVAAGTIHPLLVDAFGSRRGAVRGEFYSRLVGPVALVVLPSLVARVRRPTARTAHVGFLVLCLGVAATTFDREEVVIVGPGRTTTAAGLTVTGRGVAVEDGPRFDVQQVVATVEVDGTTMHPALVAYPERGGVLAETAVRPGLWRDVQATLLHADDLGVVRLVVRQRPLVWLVWAGAVLTAVGSFTAARRRRPVALPADGPASAPAVR